LLLHVAVAIVAAAWQMRSELDAEMTARQADGPSITYANPKILASQL